MPSESTLLKKICDFTYGYGLVPFSLSLCMLAQIVSKQKSNV